MSKEKDKLFGAYLKNLRKEKGLSLRQIESKSGVSNVYLSYLERGMRSTPSPDILKKIATPLGVTFEELMEKAGYISAELLAELHPETIQALESPQLNEFINNAAEYFISSVQDENGIISTRYKKFMVEEVPEDLNVDLEELDELLNNPDVIRDLFEALTFDEKIQFLNIIIHDFLKSDTDNEHEISKENRFATLAVPVLGNIAAGQPILAQEHIDEWTEIPNMWNLKPGEAFVLKVKGDSMIGSRIYEGDKVVVKIQPEVENGEIAVVNVNGDEATLKRVKKTENGQVILFPDNPRYDPIFINNENARIIGKVIQVMFEP